MTIEGSSTQKLSYKYNGKHLFDDITATTHFHNAGLLFHTDHKYNFVFGEAVGGEGGGKHRPLAHA